MSSIKVGFVGLGNIGLPMAKSIAKRDLPLTIYSRHQDVMDEMKSLGAVAAGSLREMAAASDVIISVVRDIPQTEEVIFGDNGIWTGINKGATIVISSTVGAQYCQELYAKAKKRGVQVVDAALSKSGPANEEGQFTLMVGGDDEAVKQTWPVFEAMAIHIFHLGDVGMGQTYKVVNQLAQRSIFGITCECLNLGLKAGLDLQKLIEVMRVSSGNSSQLQSLEHTMKLKKPSPVTKGRDKTYVRDLIYELAEKSDASTPLFRFIIELDIESVYDSYSQLIARNAQTAEPNSSNDFRKK